MAAAAAVGPRDIVLAGAVKPGALVVYDKVDHIRVSPDWNMARTGGVNFPKMFAAFDAWGYMNGPDKKPNTADDIKIDLVDVTWSMEEYTATLDDDDIKFVGQLDAKSGRFTPAIEGPNEQRSGDRNNIGDVWVVATYTGARRPHQGPGAPAGGAAGLHAVRYLGDFTMSTARRIVRGTRRPAAIRRREHRGRGVGIPGISPGVDTVVRLGEFHTFEASGERFGYMVPSAAVFAFDACASAIADALAGGPRTIGDLVAALESRFRADEVWDTLGELYRVRAIDEDRALKPAPKILPLTVDSAADAGGQRHQPVQPELRRTATSTARTRSSTPRTASSRSS